MEKARTLEFVVPGRPVGYVRTTRYKMHVDKYYKRSRDYRDYVAYIAIQALKSDPGFYCEKGIAVELEAKAYLRGKRRIDVDNLLKNLMDAGNKIIYDDDSQIIKATIEKNHVDALQDERMEVKLIRATSHF